MQGAPVQPRATGLHILVTVVSLAAMLSILATGGSALAAGKERTSRLTDAAVFDASKVPTRPPRLEIGDHFLGNGNISEGIRLPTGAVWNPSLLVYGLARTAIQGYDTGNNNDLNCGNAVRAANGTVLRSGDESICGEWANRLDINVNLILTGTERIVFGMRPIDDGFVGGAATTGDFSGYYFEPRRGKWNNGLDDNITMLFGEFEVAELFPALDRDDRYPFLDVGFTVGRQQFFYQEGLLIFDFMDGFGISKNQIQVGGASNLQVSALFAWNEINRGNNVEATNTNLYGLFFAMDHPKSTINFDLVYTNDKKNGLDGFYGGLSFVQRIGHFATAFRAVWSVANDNEPPRSRRIGTAPTSVVDDGGLFFAELAWTPPWTHNNLYANAFAGFGHYTPAARAPGAGGPLGRAGISFAGAGLGRYGAALSNFGQDVVGLAIGYQMILDGDAARRQLIFEIAGRQHISETRNTPLAARSAAALSMRFQQAFGKRWLLQLDGFGSVQHSRSPGWGGRMEWRMAF